MLRATKFAKKTRKGRVTTVAREHYLRDDIFCGIRGCSICLSQEKGILDGSKDILVPDTNVVLHQLDWLEHKHVTNVVICSTVLNEVKHRSLPAYNRLKAIFPNKDKQFYLFSNEHSRETFIDRKSGESPNDRNDRAIRACARWYTEHNAKQSISDRHQAVVADNNEGSDGTAGVGILLTEDRDNRDKAVQEGCKAYRVSNYVKRFSGHPELVDLLAAGFSSSGQQQHSDICPEDLLQYDKQFAEYLDLPALQRGIKSGSLLQGTFHASRDTIDEGFVSVRDKGRVFVSGKDINRAVQGDTVAVRMLPKDQWKASSDVVQKKEGAVPLLEGGLVDTDDTLQVGAKPLPTCVVVGIVRRRWRPFCAIMSRQSLEHVQSAAPEGGTAQQQDVKDAAQKEGAEDGSESTHRCLFEPQDERVPLIRVKTTQAEKLIGQKVVISIDSWPRASRYPMGHVVRTIGPIGDVATETEVVLLEHEVPFEPFSQAVLDCLPTESWSITEDEVARRRDLRHLNICSVDPPGCTDIDDALHVRTLSNGNYEVGVHIADVTHFVRPGTELDQEASKRGTTVYLANRRIDMVPELLSSNLCSLRGGEERLAFSCLWEMTPDAEIVRTEFAKTVIRSRAALMYSQAQKRIDDKSDNSELTKGLRILNSLAKKLKKQRFDRGALMLASSEVKFSLNSETHDPVQLETKEVFETNSMVEEFMLLANVSVADHIYQHFPQCAVLRRHPTPPPTQFEGLLQAASHAGVELSVGSSKELADSLDRASTETKPYMSFLLRLLATRCMLQAVYFASGTQPPAEFVHYGLASPIYTHFTSPIRRYADVMVHRLLAASIGADKTYPDLLDKDKISSVCDRINRRNRMAQYASRASIELHSIMFFKTRSVVNDGFITRVKRNAVQVLVPEYGFEGPVFFDVRDDVDKDKTAQPELDFDAEAGSLRVSFREKSMTFRALDRIRVRVYVDTSDTYRPRMAIGLVSPTLPGISMPDDAKALPAAEKHAALPAPGPPGSAESRTGGQSPVKPKKHKAQSDAGESPLKKNKKRKKLKGEKQRK